ncbi:hypothetical protein GCM10009768_03440 [Leucobacter iarius]|uniref:Uncharacterized protein n=1 Tax=Leucobacter iarius TaxID=333963 RepID=A0ABN2L7Q6_9MICO
MDAPSKPQSQELKQPRQAANYTVEKISPRGRAKIRFMTVTMDAIEAEERRKDASDDSPGIRLTRLALKHEAVTRLSQKRHRGRDCAAIRAGAARSALRRQAGIHGYRGVVWR